MILVFIPPHLPPHGGCAGANYRSIKRKIFRTEFWTNFCDSNSYFDTTAQGIQHSKIFAIPPKMTRERRQEQHGAIDAAGPIPTRKVPFLTCF